MIGQGAFGEVYHAQQPGVGRPVAVKKIRSRFANQPDFIRRFEAEAQVIARLEHPHIVPLYDYWREADGAFLVMRYMRGGSLKGMLENGALDLETTLSLIDQVGAALAFAHQQGFVHRDIKPANILLDETGNGYLSDFGIVKDLSLDDDDAPSDSVTGTPAYLSPEQALSKDITPLSDLYSLGVMLYEMLTGAKPFDDSTSPSRLLVKQVEEPLPLVSTTHPAIPPAVDEVIQRATAKDAAARFDDIPAMVRALHLAAQKDGKGIALPEDFVQLEDELVNPYKGLRSFQEADAVNFFGRQALVEQLLTRFETAAESNDSPTNRFLAVVGPSGSGKSSVVKAGLLPALRRGGVTGSEKWFMVEMIPGIHPLEELEAALLRIAVDPPESLMAQLQEDEGGLARVLEQVLPEDGSELLLMVDQFEELFTLVEDEQQRRHVINSLLTALHVSNSRLRVVITVRADFYDRPLMTPGLADLMRQCTEIVPPLNKMELEEVIVQPALQVGAIFEDGLVPVIIDDVSEQPGALPLLQYALTELFERRQERLLTKAAYEEIGGVLGALGRRAEELYTELDEEGEEAARQLFMRLVTLGEGTEDTRRRVLRSELTALQTSEVLKTSEVLDAYGRYRLLTFDRDPLSREPTVEVAHEALLRDWPRLRQWLDESRGDVRIQRRLATATAEWMQSEKSDDYLLRGSRLDLFIGWFATSQLALTQEEQAFLDASEAARQQRQAEEDARARRELETAQQLAREQTQRAEEQAQAAQGLRRRALFLGAALVIAALLAIAAIFFANQSNRNAETAVTEANQRATAQALAEANEADAVAQQATAEAEAQIRATAEVVAVREQTAAEEQAAIAFSRELAASALDNLDEDPELSVLLAMQALSVEETMEAEETLRQAIQASRVRQTMHAPDNILPGWGTYNPDGTLLFTSGMGGGVMWDMSGSPTVVYTKTVSGQESYPPDLITEVWIGRADFSPDGSLIALPGEMWAGEEFVEGSGKVSILDAESGQEQLSFVAHDSAIQEAKFSPDGTRLATAGIDEGMATVWDLDATFAAGEGMSLFTLPHGETVWGVAFSPDGQLLATAAGSEGVIVWDAATGEELRTIDSGTFTVHVAFSPDGQYLTSTGFDAAISVWDPYSGQLIDRRANAHGDATQTAVFNNDGTKVSSAGSDNTARVWEFSDGEIRQNLFTFGGHTDTVAQAPISPDDRYQASVSTDGTIRIWDISATGGKELGMFDQGGDTRGVSLSPDGARLVTSGFDGSAKVWDIASGELLLTLEGHNDWVLSAKYDPDGQIIATAGQDGTVRLWDAQSGAGMRVIEAHERTDPNQFFSGATDLAFSPDGEQLATTGTDRLVRVWHVESGVLLLTMEGHDDWAMRIAYSPDGQLIATASTDGTARIWDAEDGEEIWTLSGNPTPAWGVDFDPQGNRVVAGYDDGEVIVYQLPSASSSTNDSEPEIVTRFSHDAGWVGGVHFSPDGQLLAVPGFSRVALWDANSGEVIKDLPHPLGSSRAIFNADSSRVVTGGTDGFARIFVVETEDLIELAKTRVTRSLTEEECRQYLHLESCPVE
jgi:WD40 repeat protein/serine/threonine protein kinase